MTRRAPSGFTLTELAISLAIVGLLLGSLMYSLWGRIEQRNFEATQERLETARELLLGFAVTNGRLPCPARSTSAADEVRNAAGECKDAAGIEDYYGGPLAGGAAGGFLPARAIGFQPVDADGYAVDAWGNRLRYAVARTVTGCSGTAALPHFTSAANLKANGIACQPSDLVVCRAASGASGTSCGPSANVVTNQNVVAAIVFSIGANPAASPAAGTDEAANLNGDPVFVSHLPAPAGAAGGGFDDNLVWIPVGLLYARMIQAGVLP